MLTFRQLRTRKIEALTLALFSLAAFHLLQRNSYAAIPTQERQALIDLYNSTNGPKWINGTGWLGATGTECGTGQTTIASLSSNNNQPSGSIPFSQGSLAALLGLAIPNLVDFLNSEELGWQNTQTVAPAGVSATAQSSSSILVSWAPIAYTADTGRYQVCQSVTIGGPYTLDGSASPKSASSLLYFLALNKDGPMRAEFCRLPSRVLARALRAGGAMYLRADAQTPGKNINPPSAEYWSSTALAAGQGQP
jgi:hypothetical protein